MTLTDAGGQVAASAMTDAAGRYTLDDLLPGRYSLTATADGHLPRSLPVALDQPGTTTLDVDLVGCGGSPAW